MQPPGRGFVRLRSTALRQGWQVVGSVPNFPLMPDGALRVTTYFHKQL